ncbi:MAG TPA: molybdopterin-binding protein [Anaeromyxobacter sp.]|nr:molybdopterin-binding protein [Anaeromyxobacter sp.]
MARADPPATGGPPPDARLRGFADRVPLERAVAWLDAAAPPLPAVEVAVAGCVGRVPASPVAAPAPLPAVDRAGEDGWAVRAAETVGATAWGPASLRVQDSGAPLAPGGAALVAAGAPIPSGADAIVPFDGAEARGASLEVLAPVAEGSGVERAGRAVPAGAPVVGGRRPLRPHDAALLAAAGIERIAVVARPRVRILVAGPKAPASAFDAHGPMLRALVARDGGDVEVERAGASGERLARAAAAAELVIVTGRSGTGPDDDAAPALAAAGELAVHGIALRPGGSAALGTVAGRPVVVLPGDPLACLCAYELLAGRVVRGLGGRDPELPHPRREVEVGRKIASAVGVAEVVQVRLVAGRVEPLGVADFGGLASAAAADGFVVVPAAVEGYAPGARVTVHAY